MKKIGFLLILAMCLTATVSWATPMTGTVSLSGTTNEQPVIIASVDTVAFGDIVVGYKVTQRFTVTGLNLSDDLTLSISDDRYQQYTVSPSSITPEKAAQGITVTVTVSPFNPYTRTAMLTLASTGADAVMIPITIDIYRAPSLPTNNQLSTYVGGITSICGTINFPDAEIPPDPNNPVVMSPAIGNSAPAQVAPGFGTVDYSYSIQGDNCFGVIITKGSSIAKTCDVTITYSPQLIGTHNATITFICSRGGIPVTVNVSGTAIEAEPGDVNGDGFMTISDATGLIDMLLCPITPPAHADVNGDGTVSIIDVTTLIDMLLTGN